MIDYLQWIADISLPVFVVSTMLAMGMSQHLGDVVAPLTRPAPVVLALLVNFVISPVMAVTLSRLFRSSRPTRQACCCFRRRPAPDPPQTS